MKHKKDTMKKLFCLLMLFTFLTGVNAQSAGDTPARKGFAFGFSFGGGILNINANGTEINGFAPTLPNLYLGYSVNPKLTLQLLLPGSTYDLSGKTRGFEGYILSAKTWVKDRVWVMGGSGLCFDAPAFWTVSDPRKAEFNLGFPAFALGTGYEFYRKGRFTSDIQYRFYYGNTKLENGGNTRGVSNMLSVGFNWY